MLKYAGRIGCSALTDLVSQLHRGWSGNAMVLGKLPVPGRPTIWMIVGQGPIALAVGAGEGRGGGGLDIFTLFFFSLLCLPLWETARYRLKYCPKGPLDPKQPTNQPTELHLSQRFGSLRYTLY